MGWSPLMQGWMVWAQKRKVVVREKGVLCCSGSGGTPWTSLLCFCSSPIRQGDGFDINRTSWWVPAADRNHDQGTETWTSPRLAEARRRPSWIEAISGHRYPLFFPPIILLIAYSLVLCTPSMKLYALAFVILCTTSGLVHDCVSLSDMTCDDPKHFC